MSPIFGTRKAKIEVTTRGWRIAGLVAVSLGLSVPLTAFSGEPERQAAIERADRSRANGDNAAAEQHLRKALEEAESMQDEQKIAEGLGDLGDHILEQVSHGAPKSRYSEVEPLFLRKMAIHAKRNGGDSLEVQEDLEDLVTLYRLQGRFAEADAMRERRLAISKAKN